MVSDAAELKQFLTEVSLYWGTPVAAFIAILMVQMILTPATASLYPALVVGAITPLLIYWQRPQHRGRLQAGLIAGLYLIGTIVVVSALRLMRA